MNTADLLDTTTTAREAIHGWGKAAKDIRIGQKIRVTFSGQESKTGYAYIEEGQGLGIRYTWRSRRWWSLLNYNNPLTKLEAQEMDGQGVAYWVTLWEKSKA